EAVQLATQRSAQAGADNENDAMAIATAKRKAHTVSSLRYASEFCRQCEPQSVRQQGFRAGGDTWCGETRAIDPLCLESSKQRWCDGRCREPGKATCIPDLRVVRSFRSPTGWLSLPRLGETHDRRQYL